MMLRARSEFKGFSRVSLAAIAAVLIGLITGLYYHYELHELIEVRYATLEEVLELKANNLESWLSERRYDLNFYSTDPRNLRDLARLESGDRTSRARLEEEFKDRIDRHRMSAARVETARGRTLLRIPAAPGFKDANFELTAPLDLPGGRATLTLSFPWDQKTARGIDYWPRDMKTANTYLVNVPDGTMVPHNGIDHKIAGARPLMLRAARGESGRIAGLDYRGVYCDAISRPVRGTNWILFAKSDRGELKATARGRAAIVLALLIAVFVLLAVYIDRGAQSQRAVESDFNLLALAIAQMRESVVLTDAAGTILYVNPAFTEASGYTREEAVGKNPRVLKSGLHDAAFYSAIWSTLGRGETWRGRISNRAKDGHIYEEDASISPVVGADGKVVNYVAVKRDISAERSLEDQLRQSQKMEAIGRLAGGVAHDFNNILTSILGYAEIASSSLPPGTPLAEDLGEITRAGKLAAALTRQLLTFSRKQVITPTTFDLNLAVAAIEKMLRRTLPEPVERVLELSPEPVWVHIDPAQVDQILLNLAVNASDAMAGGGRLRFTTATVHLTKPLRYSLWTVPPGRYARLSVIDTGHGIPANIMEHIFEPFFTTKEKGRGTGLGLATVFGIVKQANGHVIVDSTPGKGTLFAVYLPLAETPGELEYSAGKTAALGAHNGEVVALVEDQEIVLRLTEKILKSAGYRVVPFASASEALTALTTRTEALHLLLTDVVMPEMSGGELAAAVRARRPDLPVLFMSGYTDDIVAKAGRLEPGTDLIQKPFTPDELLARVRASLDAKP